MNYQEPQSESSASGARARFPRVTAIASVVLVGAGGLVYASVHWLHHWLRVDPAIPMLIGIGLCAVAYLWWVGWIAFRSGWPLRWRALAVLILCAPFFAWGLLLKPVVGGDLDIVRWEWRFWETPRSLAQSAESVDVAPGFLQQSTPWDFPEFLGVDRRGVVHQVELNPEWERQPPQLKWRINVGHGWSGIVAVNGALVTMEQRGDQESITCYTLSRGELVWKYSHAARHEDTGGLGKVGPRSTPTLHEGRVYAQGATGLLVCLDGQDGSLIWRRDLCEILGIERQYRVNAQGYRYEEEPALAWGRAASPLIVGDLVVTTGGGNPGGPKTTLLAFDKHSGNEVWRGGDQMIGYGSPSLATVGGVPQILLVAERTAMGFEPHSGRVLWQTDRPGNSGGSANCSQVTAVSDYHLLLTKGYGLGGQLIAVEWQDGQWTVETVWSDHRVLTTKLTNPVIHDGHAYALADGFLECVRLDEGKLCWKQRGRFSHGQVLRVGGLLLVHAQDGRMTLVRATPARYEPLGELATVKGVCWNTFCVYHNLLIVRSDLEMACFELPIIERLTLGEGGS